MVDAAVIAAEMARADEVLLDLAGETVETLAVSSIGREEAPFLGQIVSKLSPMIGNLLERRVIQILDQEASESGHGMRWLRQDPGFPDALLVDRNGVSTEAGYEVKAWYALSTELTGRFKESQNLLRPRNVRVVIVAWCMSHLVYGQPQILNVLTVPGIEVAESRDQHYHKPPEYLCVEPGYTTARTRNLLQTNVNGYRLQETTRAYIQEARNQARQHSAYGESSASPEGQQLSRELMSRWSYRPDTNFAKIDRVDNPDIERFKASVLASSIRGRSIKQWAGILKNLNLEEGSLAQRSAAELIRSIYAEL